MREYTAAECANHRSLLQNIVSFTGLFCDVNVREYTAADATCHESLLRPPHDGELARGKPPQVVQPATGDTSCLARGRFVCAEHDVGKRRVCVAARSHSCYQPVHRADCQVGRDGVSLLFSVFSRSTGLFCGLFLRSRSDN